MEKHNIRLTKHLKEKNIVAISITSLFSTLLIISILLKAAIWVNLVIILFAAILQVSLQHIYSKKFIKLVNVIKTILEKEILESENTYEKVIDLSTKQQLITSNYINQVKEVNQSIFHFKNISAKTKEHAQDVATKAQESLNFSQRESEAVKANIAMMLTLKQKIQTIAELILELSDYIQQIGNTVGIVEDIAEQTNMLALNAAVEAARAGEHGKGFAVVAGEIRKLADESKQATTKISSLINDIEQATNSTVMATEEGTKEIESGVILAHNIDINICNLISLMNELTKGIEGILNSTIDQAVLSDDVINIVEELDKELNNSTNNLEENIKNIKAFSKISTTLKENVIS